MLTWALDPLRNDLLINGSNTLQTIYGSDEVRQRILITLKHMYQEYFLNVPAGVPWYEYILGSKDMDTVVLILREAVLNVPNVVSIVNLSAAFSTTVKRQLVFSALVEVLGLNGPTIIDIEQQLIGGSK